MDGSAAPFVQLIEGTGILELPVPRRFVRITREIEVSQGGATAQLRPYDGFRAAYTFVADHPVFTAIPSGSRWTSGTPPT